MSKHLYKVEKRNKSINFWMMALLFFALNAYAKEVQLTPDNFRTIWGDIQPGDKVIFASGEYREELLLRPNRVWSVKQPTLFVAANPGAVIIKGSDVVHGWQKLNGTQYVKEWLVEPSQVFVDGVSLKQLAGTIFGGFPTDLASTYHNLLKGNGGIWPGRAAYIPGSAMPMDSFYYDKLAHKIYINIKGDANQRKIEVSIRRRPFFAEGVSGIVLDGLIFEHSNTSVWGRGAAVTILGNDNVVRNVTIKNADLTGIQMDGERNKLLNSSIRNSGQLGVAMRGTNNQIINVDASYNNTRGFNKWWEAGGFKFVGNGGLQSSEFIENTAFGNKGDGIWFDWENKNNLIRGNVAAYNTGFGIHYEASRLAVIQDNYVYGNGQRGIYLPDSANSWVTHNLVVGNGMEGIVAVYTGRKDGKGVEFGAEDNKIYSNIVGWNNDTALIMPKGASRLGEADGNVYLGTQKSIKFSLGYATILSPAVYSLSEWSRISALDAKSVVGEMPMPKAISDGLAKQEVITDWSTIQELASKLRKEKGLPLSDVLLPGRQEDVVGPRKIK